MLPEPRCAVVINPHGPHGVSGALLWIRSGTDHNPGKKKHHCAACGQEPLPKPLLFEEFSHARRALLCQHTSFDLHAVIQALVIG